jgi:hypothetical protein
MNQVLRDPEEEKMESLDVRETKFKEGQEIEKKYKDRLKQFEQRIKWIEGEVGMRVDPIMKVHAPKLYEDLRSEGIPITDARAIVIGRLIHYRAERTIVHYLPDEAKDKRQQKKAHQSNAAQADKRLEKVAREVEQLALDSGKTKEEAKEEYEKCIEGGMRKAAGRKGWYTQYKDIDPGEMADRGSKGGTQRGENIKNRKETEELGEEIKAEIVNEEEEEETEDMTNEKLITVKIVRPDINNDKDEEVRHAIKIDYCWEKYGVAYLHVNQQGKIVNVFNADTETQEQYIERTEEPIEASE